MRLSPSIFHQNQQSNSINKVMTESHVRKKQMKLLRNFVRWQQGSGTWCPDSFASSNPTGGKILQQDISC